MSGAVALVVATCVFSAGGCASKETRLAQRAAMRDVAVLSEMCQWPESEKRALNPIRPDDRMHLSNDLRVIQARASLAAKQVLYPGDRRLSSFVNACASQMHTAASRAHGVTEAQLRDSAQMPYPSMPDFIDPGWPGFPPSDSH